MQKRMHRTSHTHNACDLKQSIWHEAACNKRTSSKLLIMEKAVIKICPCKQEPECTKVGSSFGTQSTMYNKNKQMPTIFSQKSAGSLDRISTGSMRSYGSTVSTLSTPPSATTKHSRHLQPYNSIKSRSINCTVTKHKTNLTHSILNSRD